MKNRAQLLPAHFADSLMFFQQRRRFSGVSARLPSWSRSLRKAAGEIQSYATFPSRLNLCKPIPAPNKPHRGNSMQSTPRGCAAGDFPIQPAVQKHNTYEDSNRVVHFSSFRLVNPGSLSRVSCLP
ncbi:MAG: hypothetical protein ACLS6G_08310 [Christensenellales bacterium]